MGAAGKDYVVGVFDELTAVKLAHQGFIDFAGRKVEFLTFEAAVQDALLVVAKLLADYGPQLGRPYADTLNGSQYANTKELRFEAFDGEWLAAFAFDPHRQAILLVAGDKSGGSQRRFYRQLIAKTDKRFSAHLRKPRTGEHGCATAEDALAVMRSMAGRWLEQHIAASLNRMGLPTGQGKTWTAHRVSSVRRVRRIHAYRSAENGGEWLTMSEAAKALGVTSHLIRRLITTGVLPAAQVVPGAPHQIRADDLAFL